jgi:hypothetical protein
MAFEEDMSVFFDTDDFADKAIITPKGITHPSSKSVEVSVIAEQRYVEGTKVDGYSWTILGDKSAFDAKGIGFGAMVTLYKNNGCKLVDKDMEIKDREPEESDNAMTMWVLQ